MIQHSSAVKRFVVCKREARFTRCSRGERISFKDIKLVNVLPLEPPVGVQHVWVAETPKRQNSLFVKRETSESGTKYASQSLDVSCFAHGIPGAVPGFKSPHNLKLET